MLNGQEEPEGKVARAAKTNFLAQDPHSPGSFLFAKGELRGTAWGVIFPYSWKLSQRFEEEKEEIFSSAQAQPSCQLFFLLGWDRTGW